MTTLFALVLLALISSSVCAVSFLVVLVILVRHEGWGRGLCAIVFPPYAFAWGWQHRNAQHWRSASAWMTAWTLAAGLTLGIVVLCQIVMG